MQRPHIERNRNRSAALLIELSVEFNEISHAPLSDTVAAVLFSDCDGFAELVGADGEKVAEYWGNSDEFDGSWRVHLHGEPKAEAGR